MKKYVNGEYIEMTPEEIQEHNRIAGQPEEDQTTFTREEFNLLEVQQDGVIYTIYEEDGTITYLKGENR